MMRGIEHRDTHLSFLPALPCTLLAKDQCRQICKMALGWLFLLLSTREPANQYMGTTAERQLRRSQRRLLTRQIFNAEDLSKATGEAVGFRMGLTSCRGRPAADSLFLRPCLPQTHTSSLAAVYLGAILWTSCYSAARRPSQFSTSILPRSTLRSKCIRAT